MYVGLVLEKLWEVVVSVVVAAQLGAVAQSRRLHFDVAEADHQLLAFVQISGMIEVASLLAMFVVFVEPK